MHNISYVLFVQQWSTFISDIYTYNICGDVSLAGGTNWYKCTSTDPAVHVTTTKTQHRTTLQPNHSKVYTMKRK